MAGRCTGLRRVACFSAAHGLSPNALNALRHVAKMAESRNRFCQPLSGGAGARGCAAVFPKVCAGSRCWRWRQRSLVDVFSHGAGLYPCPVWRPPGSIATRWRCFWHVRYYSVVIALAYLRNAGTAMRRALWWWSHRWCWIRLDPRSRWVAGGYTVIRRSSLPASSAKQALAQLRDVYFRLVSQRRECSAFAAGGLRNARGTLVAGSVLPLRRDYAALRLLYCRWLTRRRSGGRRARRPASVVAFVSFLPRLRRCLSGAGVFAGAGAGQHRYDAPHSLWRLSVCLSC